MSTADFIGQARPLLTKVLHQSNRCPESLMRNLVELYGQLSSFEAEHAVCLNKEYLMYDVQKVMVTIEQYCWSRSACDDEFTTNILSHLVCIEAMIEFSLNMACSNDNLQNTHEITQNHIHHIRALDSAFAKFTEIMHFARTTLKPTPIQRRTP